MISHKHRFIFIHIPKTAGTSIEEALRDETCQLLPGEWDHGRVRHTPLNHLTLQELADYNILTPAQLKSYFKFCFVRNPWDRLISEIFCPWMSPWFKDLTVDQRIRRACELAATTKGIANHLRLQQDFVNADGLQMDFIGRFEQLEEDFGHLCRLLGIEAALPHLNRSAHRPYQEYYDEETQALTAATYRRDIEAFQYKFGEAAGGRVVVRETERKVDERAMRSSGTRKITAYSLYDQAVPLQPAAEERAWVKTNEPGELAVVCSTEPAQNPAYADLDLASAARQGWQLRCPVAFECTWNGGPNVEDIEIHLAEDATAQAGFVQSHLGEGLLTFYPGYQFKTDGEQFLWVRGPINAPKDGLHPLEYLVDTSMLPCTIAVHWKFTRSHQTIRFAASEPFATLLLYPKAGLEEVSLEVIQREGDAEAYEQAFQQMADAPAVRDLFQRLGATPAAPTQQAETGASDPKTTPSTWAAQLTNPPSVSCICPTYGRVELLEEAIYSFLQQDYPGQKELIVLNDYDQQTLEFDHPEVRIVNLPNRFHSVGEKYKAAVALASHDLIFVWHDDDIYLPHRLSFAVAQFDQNKAFFKADKAWFWNEGKLSGPERNVFHGGSCWRRDLFSKVHGYPHIGNQYDIEFERLCKAEAPGAIHVEPIKADDIYYIYRWRGTGSYHFSSMGADGQEHQKVAAYVAQQAACGQIPQGEIQIQPHWKSDYGALVQTYLATPPTAQDAPQAKRTATAQAINPLPASCFDTIDGRIDLQQFEPGFFFPERFLGRPREDFLRRHGEVFRRDFYVIDALKLAYLSVPKAACTAIKLALAKAIGIDFEPDQDIEYVVHFHPQWHREQGRLTKAQNGYYRFSFVRNPFDRLVSCYRGKIIFARTPKTRTPLYHDYFFALPVNISFADFAQRVSRIPDALADSHFKSQYALLYSGEELQVDYVGKFEQLDRDWQPIAEKYQLDPLLSHANVSKNKPGCQSDYRLYYTEALVKLVYERYRKDVHLFGYEEEYKQLLAFVREHPQNAAPGFSEWERDKEKERRHHER